MTVRLNVLIRLEEKEVPTTGLLAETSEKLSLIKILAYNGSEAACFFEVFPCCQYLAFW
jgi:hypothetical protein